MKIRSVLTLLALAVFMAAAAQGGDKDFNRAGFYKVMQADVLKAVDAELGTVRNAQFSDKEAFEGTLLMKKAGIVSKPGEKLRLFKAGRLKLEAAIRNQPENGELRFHRLMIQENAPDILGYNKDTKTDKELVLKTFKNLPQTVQQAVQSYSKKSKLITPADL